MGGLILDNIFVFLFRLMRRFWRQVESKRWNKTTGAVRSSSSPEHEMYPYASLSYSYKVNDEKHFGEYVRGYWYSDGAAEFASRYAPPRKIVIRYCPDRPERSYFLDKDQPRDLPNRTGSLDRWTLR